MIISLNLICSGLWALLKTEIKIKIIKNKMIRDIHIEISVIVLKAKNKPKNTSKRDFIDFMILFIEGILNTNIINIANPVILDKIDKLKANEAIKL